MKQKDLDNQIKLDERINDKKNEALNKTDLKDFDAEEIVDLIEDLPDEKKVKFIKKLAISQEFSGPVPPPDILEGYEKCLPGSADRILAMAEKEQSHRHGRENNLLKTVEKSENKGMNFAFIVTMSFVLLGSILLYLGKDLEGAGVLSPVIIQFFVHIFKNFKDSKKTETENSIDISEDFD